MVYLRGGKGSKVNRKRVSQLYAEEGLSLRVLSPGLTRIAAHFKFQWIKRPSSHRRVNKEPIAFMTLMIAGHYWRFSREGRVFFADPSSPALIPLTLT
jgi:hypothetical protein